MAVLVVVGGSLGGDDSGGSSAPEVSTSEPVTNTVTAPPRRERANYTIKAGDTLGAISERTGITVETLQQLNPELDPQALIAGQKIKLRE